MSAAMKTSTYYSLYFIGTPRQGQKILKTAINRKHLFNTGGLCSASTCISSTTHV